MIDQGNIPQVILPPQQWTGHLNKCQVFNWMFVGNDSAHIWFLSPKTEYYCHDILLIYGWGSAGGRAAVNIFNVRPLIPKYSTTFDNQEAMLSACVQAEECSLNSVESSREVMKFAAFGDQCSLCSTRNLFFPYFQSQGSLQSTMMSFFPLAFM